MASNPRPILPKARDGAGPGAWSKPEGPDQRRRRGNTVETACSACRLRRSKCDGQRPTCATCKTRDTECKYDTEPGQTRGAAMKQRIDKAEAQSASLTAILWYLKTHPTKEVNEFLHHLKSHGTNINSMLSWIHERDPSSISEGASPFTPDFIKSSSTSDLFSQSQSAPTQLGVKEEFTNSQIVRRAALADFSHTQAPKITIASLVAAIKHFFTSTGSFFFVMSQDEVKLSLQEVLGDSMDDETLSLQACLDRPMSNRRGAQIAELCGLAATGMLFDRVQAGKYVRSSTDNADYVYFIAKSLLEHAILDHPLRAMKLCASLSLFNIVLKSVIAVTYVELGLSLGFNHEFRNSKHGTATRPEELGNYRKTLRTLSLYQRWFSASIGYNMVPQSSIDPELPEHRELNAEDLIQDEMWKVTLIKANIIRRISPDQIVEPRTIHNFRVSLKDFHGNLPVWMSFNMLVQSDTTQLSRRYIFYLHLFYLPAMQLLYRRVFGNLAGSKAPPSSFNQQANEAIKEGLMAAKMAAQILRVMKREGYIIKLCWLCIFTSYTTGIMILQAATQKLLNGFGTAMWTADLALTETTLEILELGATESQTAERFRDTLRKYYEVIRIAVDGGVGETPYRNLQEQESIAYLFALAEGETDMHRAARDLFYLTHRPFENTLELLPHTRVSNIELGYTACNPTGAGIGATFDSRWELEYDILSQIPMDESASASGLEAMSKDSESTIDESESQPAWTFWTPPSLG